MDGHSGVPLRRTRSGALRFIVRLYEAAEVPPARRHLDPVSAHLTDCYLQCPGLPVQAVSVLLPRLP
jgi:hypothetical protein